MMLVQTCPLADLEDVFEHQALWVADQVGDDVGIKEVAH
jgi:hypothetical protein